MVGGADGALCPADLFGPAPKGAAFYENDPARTLNRRSWFHVQARKADEPRLSACTCNIVTSASLQGAVFCLGNLAGRLCDITAWADESERMAGFAVTG